jgi:nicotinate-nucleotide pyrophosphorylase (carboxylating)
MIAEHVLRTFIENALREDLGNGDHSSLSCIPHTANGKAHLLVKENGIISGIDVAKAIFKHLDASVVLDAQCVDGDQVNEGDIAFVVHGQVHTLLAGERLALNCMQRMSGIATYTNRLQSMIAHTNCTLLDTRKTTPGMRALEKQAVVHGGGANHRMGLYDMIMLKDNHIDYAGSISNAISKVKRYLDEQQLQLPIEVEARDLIEVEEILRNGPVDRIMLDNFKPSDVKKAVARIGNKAETEASGGITEKTIVTYAETGVQFISVGALTHSVKSLDMSLKAIDA